MESNHLEKMNQED